MDHQTLRLKGKDAEHFWELHPKDKVNLRISGFITDMGMEDFYEDHSTVKPGGKIKKPKKQPYVNIDVTSINGRSGKAPEDLSDDEVEEEIESAKTYTKKEKE